MRQEPRTLPISTAAITNYEHLYGRGYYAHVAGSASFDTEQLPEIIAGQAVGFKNLVLDIGGGNGMLGQALAGLGVRTLTVDAADREAPDYIRVNLAAYDPVGAGELRRRVIETLGKTYVSTCFDVAEHIDVEHLADFVLNLVALVDTQLLLSVSTRPSSAANRFHSSVLPITTWQRLFSLAGFTCQPFDELQNLRSYHRFSGGDANLIAVSHWQRRNPFREDHASHQHYLLLSRTDIGPFDISLFRKAVDDLTDTTYRRAKRDMVVASELPILNYHVNFIQDWSFVRSLMDVWPTGRLRITLREDIIAKPYLHMLVAFLERTACPHAVISSVSNGIAAMESWGGLEDSIVMTATEGLTSMTHVMGSLLLIEARKRRARTLSLQHGMSIIKNFNSAAGVVGAWDDGSARTLRGLSSKENGSEVVTVGSPKFLDALLPSSSAALRNRLGAFVAEYDQIILIGLNMHWSVHLHGTGDTYDWIVRVARANPENLFLLRPHPDDSSSYHDRADNFPNNVMIVDEMLLLSIDWPVARLIRAVDGVISTYSTLLIDAAAAGKPIVLLPSDNGNHNDGFLPKSTPWAKGVSQIATLSEQDWVIGRLPGFLSETSAEYGDASAGYFEPSWSSLARIARLGENQHPGDLAAAEQSINCALASAAREFSYDTHPHRDRELITSAIFNFVSN